MFKEESFLDGFDDALQYFHPSKAKKYTSISSKDESLKKYPWT
jgi:hypothetical protein